MTGIDVSTLTRLANEMFSALSSSEGAPSAVELAEKAASKGTSAAHGSSAVTGAAPSELRYPSSFGVPGDDEIRGLLQQHAPQSFPGAPAHAPGLSAAVAPSFGGATPALGTATPSFYFLEHVRSPASALQAPGVSALQAPGVAEARTVLAPFDIHRVRRDFPILAERVGGKQLVWLDNAATTQKPRAVIERLKHFYEHENSNIHRGAHELAARATDAYEDAREKARSFLNASSTREIVFVRGATEAINLVAQTFGRSRIGAGDEIIVSHLEHHANIVPWQQLAQEKGAKLRVIPVDDDGQLILGEYEKLLGPRTKLVSVTHVSNALGTVTPVQRIVELAHAAGARVLIDGAQAVSHTPVNVQSLGADFYVFSGHKVFGPTGIGVLYGKAQLLDELPPWQGGGNMIEDVTFETTRYQAAPARFEAGTGNIADAVGLGAALDYVTRIGMPLIEAYEQHLLAYGTALLKNIPGVRLVGTAKEKAGVLSFLLDGYRTEEVSHALSEDGIAVRGGHHCAQPILRRFGLESTVRPSLAFYNDCSDLDALARSVSRLSSQRRTQASVPSLHVL